MQALLRSKEQVLIGRVAKRKLEEEQKRKGAPKETAPKTERQVCEKPVREKPERAAGHLGAGKIIGRILLVLLTTVAAVALALVVIVASIIHGPSPSARDTFVTTVLESGNLKFLATMFLSEDEINEIVSRTSMAEMETDINEDLIATDEPVQGNFDENGVEIVQVNGRSFFGTLMIVADPSQVFVGTTYPWGEYGKELDQLVTMHGAIGGVNGGLYAADMNKGGRPYGVCVSKGEILLNDPSGWTGLYMIGLDNKNILRIEPISGWSTKQFKDFVEEQGIRDAVAFQDEATDANNHFVPLIINGEPRQLNGAGSGANPRTVIGQRADGAILLLVTDGRGASGHLGATAQDLINVMMQYGAVNAANLDGGSSSSLYYNNEYLMTSVTLYYANSSWRLPTSFLVGPAQEGGNE
ncbi:MAG: phosphodiester glycosidase family protein [Firmicutes bacterium]|nr:phosphodiester glycosidase family protein [Bacillota bacterium]